MPTAQVVTITPTTLPANWERLGLIKVSWDWSCTDGGAVVGSVTPYSLNGIVLGFEAIPDPVTTTPTASYTFTVNRSDGVDVLRGLGVGSSTATSSVFMNTSDGLGFVDSTPLTLAVAAAGNAKGGILNLFIMPLS